MGNLRHLYVAQFRALLSVAALIGYILFEFLRKVF